MILTSIVTGDENWLHHYEPKTKRQYEMAPFELAIEEESRQCNSMEGYGKCLLGCTGLHSG